MTCFQIRYWLGLGLTHGVHLNPTQALSQTWCVTSVSGTAFAGMGGRVPTWRMVPGSSTESLALDVALQCQVPPDIVQRAAHLFKVYQSRPWPLTNTLFSGSVPLMQPIWCCWAALRCYATLCMLMWLTLYSQEKEVKILCSRNCTTVCKRQWTACMNVVGTMFTKWIVTSCNSVQLGSRESKSMWVHSAMSAMLGFPSSTHIWCRN